MTRAAAERMAEAPRDGEGVPWPPARRAWGAVILLMTAYCLSYVDRTILALLVQPIKEALRLSDTQIGLLQGAFGIFFTLAIFPAGWLADRSNRMRLVAGAIACWSVATALCGLSGSFAQLFAARMGVAIGESVLQPSTPSVIADNFPASRRTLPLSLYGMAGALGVGISMIAGGLVTGLVRGAARVDVGPIGMLAPWQASFFMVGAPGLVVAALFLFVREPLRRDQGQPHGTMAELWQAVTARRRVILPHFAGITIYYVYAFAYGGWLPAFFVRVHHWSITGVGLRYGALHITGAIVGGWLGGALARSLWRRGRREANLLATALLLAASVIPTVIATLTPDVGLALSMLWIVIATHTATSGPSVGAIQEIIPNRLRGRVMAIYYAISALIGVSIGPVLIGLMNDYGFTDPQSIGKSLSITGVATLPLAAVLIYLAARQRLRLAPELVYADG